PDRAARRPLRQAAGRTRHRAEEGGGAARPVRDARRRARRRALRHGGGGLAPLPSNCTNGRLCPPSSPRAPDTQLGGGVLLRTTARPPAAGRPSSLVRMNDWLAARADALAKRSGVDRAALELSEQEIEDLLEL